MATHIWKRPRLTVRHSNEGTEFIFRVPFLAKFRKHSPCLYRALFQPRNTSWSKALIKAYSVRSLLKNVSQMSSRAKRRICFSALSMTCEILRRLLLLRMTASECFSTNS